MTAANADTLSTSLHLEALGGARIEKAITTLAEGFSSETTPRMAAKIARFSDFLPRGSTVSVTFLPGSDFSETIATARRLKLEGFSPAPHVVARLFRSADEFERGMAELSEAGVTDVVVLAGGIRRPAGPYENSMQLLETGLFERLGISRIGVAGHPEGSRDISKSDLAAALRWKNDYARQSAAALYLVTQFCFEAEPVIGWEKRLREAGNTLPIRVGIPGPATLKTLLSYARTCGIGPSMRVLTRQAKSVPKMLSVKTPDVFLRDLSVHRARCRESLLEGLHVYPLGGQQRAAAWINAVADGAIAVETGRPGFRLTRTAD